MEQLLGLVLLFERFEVGRDNKIMIIRCLVKYL